MNTSSVNLPRPRLPEQATEPAATPTFSVQPTGTYPVPENLTARGLWTFRVEVMKFAAAIRAELEKKADEIRSQGGRPEHTAEAVIKARKDCLQRMRSEHLAIERRTRRVRTVLAVILLIVATMGLYVMQNFLHSPWQVVVFAGFVLLGLFGLGLTWTVGRPYGYKRAEYFGLPRG